MGAVRKPAEIRALVIANFRQCGRIDLACKQAGVARETHYYWLKKKPDYAAAFKEAMNEVVDLLEAECMRRARDGVNEPIYHKGKPVFDVKLDEEGNTVRGKDGKPIPVRAFINRKSDYLLGFMLKGRRREVYGDKVEHGGITDSDGVATGAPIQIVISSDEAKI